MIGAIPEFKSKTLGKQILIITLISDSIGAALGYLLHPQLGVEPVMGAVYGLIGAGVVPFLWALTNAP
jgi:hypothetical protein